MQNAARPEGHVAAQVAAHELGHDAQAAIHIADQLATAAKQGDTERAAALLRRLRTALHRLQDDIATLLSERAGDLDTLRRER